MSLVSVADLQTGADVLRHYREVARRARERDSVRVSRVVPSVGHIRIKDRATAPERVIVKLVVPEEERHSHSLLPVVEYPPVAFISKYVAMECECTQMDIFSKRKCNQIALARGVAEWIAKTITPLSLPQIGRDISKARGCTRDHSSVYHSVHKIDGLRSDCAVFTARLDWLVDYIQSEWRAYNGLPEVGAGQ